MHDGSRIPSPIFTPTTKAATGHDQNMDMSDAIESHGSWIRDLSLNYYRQMAAVAENKGLILADTKFEFGEGGILADEVGTPDSSRFWDKDQWMQSTQKRESPPPFDKELMRNWGKSQSQPLPAQGAPIRLPHLNPADSRHLAHVASLMVPDKVIHETARRYGVIFQRLTGLKLEDFQKKELCVRR
jgi:phosphoribosylaminoimidazole-succinocarboxamide synthase